MKNMTLYISTVNYHPLTCSPWSCSTQDSPHWYLWNRNCMGKAKLARYSDPGSCQGIFLESCPRSVKTDKVKVSTQINKRLILCRKFALKTWPTLCRKLEKATPRKREGDIPKILHNGGKVEIKIVVEKLIENTSLDKVETILN